LSELKEKLIISRSKSYLRQKLDQTENVSNLSTGLKSTAMLIFVLQEVLFVKIIIDYFLPRILIYIQWYHN